ncbi:MAG: hypothetical protein A3H98_13170 [Bacteroidetes bacterium RIFCSPLOWO2_02_FULL_36_8]|nr:MAG: hypothetical protein A3H98_13170 [Bacteroidetes bacterium RIFCSPLOWO2_02_FULL_36_8]OFY70245.1 MAG: hypothetical protein A3G23_08870 [Bacteroidetes bacterium RIFCSPLOWO2_12_FULL_37_12]
MVKNIKKKLVYFGIPVGENLPGCFFCYSINMPIRLLITLILLAGCKNFKEQKAETGEGIITYKISYSEDNPYKDKRFLPGETNLVFKETMASFITSGMGIIQLVNLLDNEHKKYTSLLINSFGDNFAFTETSEDINEQENNPKYSFELTDDKKTIAGLECNKAIVSDLTNIKSFDIYYYSKIKVVLGNCPYKDFNYLLMEYNDTRYGLPMHLIAVKADLSPIDTTLFQVEDPGVYNWVDKKTFINIIKNLKSPIY